MKPEWLSLSEAARTLGVHPSTVRSWSNQGVLPVHRTQGGHRRYLRSEMDLWLQAQRSAGAADLQTMIQNALHNTRFQISEGRLNAQDWYNKLDEEARDQYRLSGRTLLQGLITYMLADETTGRGGAETIGYEYAARGHHCGLSSTEATHAFLFFRNVLLESMISVYESAAISSPYAWGDMYRKVTSFTDAILVALLETYDMFQRSHA